MIHLKRHQSILPILLCMSIYLSSPKLYAVHKKSRLPAKSLTKAELLQVALISTAVVASYLYVGYICYNAGWSKGCGTGFVEAHEYAIFLNHWSHEKAECLKFISQKVLRLGIEPQNKHQFSAVELLGILQNRINITSRE